MPSIRVAPLVALGLLLFGLYFLVSGLRTLTADRRRRRTWRTFPGEVVASRLDDEQVRCQVGYRSDDGTRVLFWNRFTSSVLSDPVGRPVQVLVNPADPHDAVVASGVVGGTLVGVVFTAVGAVLAAGGVTVGLFLLR